MTQDQYDDYLDFVFSTRPEYKAMYKGFSTKYQLLPDRAGTFGAPYGLPYPQAQEVVT